MFGCCWLLFRLVFGRRGASTRGGHVDAISGDTNGCTGIGISGSTSAGSKTGSSGDARVGVNGGTTGGANGGTNGDTNGDAIGGTTNGDASGGRSGGTNVGCIACVGHSWRDDSGTEFCCASLVLSYHTAYQVWKTRMCQVSTTTNGRRERLNDRRV